MQTNFSYFTQSSSIFFRSLGLVSILHNLMAVLWQDLMEFNTFLRSFPINTSRKGSCVFNETWESSQYELFLKQVKTEEDLLKQLTLFSIFLNSN